MQPRRGFASLAAALAAVVLSLLALDVLQTSASDGRVITPVTGTASTPSLASPTGRGTHAGRTHAEPPGKRVRPRGPDHRQRRHRMHKRHLSAAQKKKRSNAANARSAADPGVTIADFSFTPGAITVHVGDTIQWLNNGPSAHTATANNGSFDTGVLQKGKSASVTFHLPGKFAYHCSIHPFMHGTVVVLAKSSSTSGSGSSGNSGSTGGSGSSGSSSTAGGNTGGSSGSSGGGGSTGASGGSGSTGASGGSGSTGASGASGGTSAGSSTGGQGNLPLTGVNVLAVAALGLLLSGGGLLLHRLQRRRVS